MKKINKLALALLAAALLPGAAAAQDATIFALAQRGNIPGIEKYVSKDNILSRNADGQTLFHVAKDTATAKALMLKLNSRELTNVIAGLRDTSYKSYPTNITSVAKDLSILSLSRLKDRDGNDIVTTAVKNGNTELAAYYADLTGIKTTADTAQKIKEYNNAEKAKRVQQLKEQLAAYKVQDPAGVGGFRSIR